MIELSLWNQLATFAQCGTLSSTAEKLYISQPALSRSMNRLEEELGISLFTRTKNKIALNENGILAANYARKILEYESNAVESIRSFDSKNHTIHIGCCAPIPISDITVSISMLYNDKTISSEIQNDDVLIEGLKNNKYDIVVLHNEIEDEELYMQKYSSEQLYISLPRSNPLSNKNGIYFSELDGQNILLYSDIGFWFDIPKQKLPHSKILLQNEIEVFNAITSASVIPSFSSNRIIERYGNTVEKIDIPILDEEASTNYYCVCLKKNKTKFSKIFDMIKINKY